MKAFQLQSPRTLQAALGLLAQTPGSTPDKDAQGGDAKNGPESNPQSSPQTADGTGPRIDGYIRTSYRHPHSRRVVPMSGGQDLLTEMKEHLVEPDRVVNLKSIAGLDQVVSAGGNVRIGALATLLQIEEHKAIPASARVLVEAAHSVASPQIRSAGTLGGNLNQRPRCWYYRLEGAVCLKKGGTKCLSYSGMNKYNAIFGGGPSYIVHPSDMAPALVALDAEVMLASQSGTRTVKLGDYYTMPDEGNVTRETVLRPDEILTQVSFPTPAAGTRSTYIKFKERSSYDFALASVALVLRMEGGVIRDARVVLGGVAPVPWRATKAEAALVGKKPDEATAKAASELALEGAEPLEHNGYKIPLAKALVARAVLSLGQQSS